VQGRCILRVISPDKHLNTYLHIDVKGVFGLFVSALYPPYDIVPPSTRIPSLRPARCFKKFDSKTQEVRLQKLQKIKILDER
jgi:hypothetical protein